MAPKSKDAVLFAASLLLFLVLSSIKDARSGVAFLHHHRGVWSRRPMPLPRPSTQIHRRPKGNDCVRRTFCTPTVEATVNNDHSLRNLATEALLNVFYPIKGSEKSTLDTEKAVRNCLRNLEKNNYETSLFDSSSTSYEGRKFVRRRLSELILGTSIMRRRHWYTMACVEKSSVVSHDDMIPGCEDIRPHLVEKEPSLMADTSTVQRKENNQQNPRKRRLGIIRALVDLHAAYLADDEPQKVVAPAADRLSIQFSLPRFVTRLWVEQYGPKDAEELAGIANRPGPITLRRNALLCPCDHVLCDRLWKDHGVRAFPMDSLVKGNATSRSLPVPKGCIRIAPSGTNSTAPSIWSMNAWKDGWFEVQDAGSQVVVDAMEVSAGETVVDYCAGNGGKTLALASRLWSGGNGTAPCTSRLVAHDVSVERLRQLRGSLGRVGIGSSSLQIEIVMSNNESDSFPTWSEMDIPADVVLVDAPCSSLGVLRRRPGQRWMVTEEQVRTEFPALQLEILQQASHLLRRSGGRLIYATCSIMLTENEQIVKAFENCNSQWERWEFPPDQLRNENEDLAHCRTLLPHNVDCDGFFIARWKRK